MATIRKRGPYQWQAIVKRKGFPLTSKTFEARRDAEVWSRTIESEMDRGLYLPRNDAEETLLQDLIDRYRRDILPSKRGKSFEPALRMLEQRLGRYSLAAITPKEVARFRDSRLKAGRAASTVKKEINLLSRIIDLAGKEWGIALPANPCAMVSRPAERSARTRRLKPDEERILLEVSRPPMQAIIGLALETAARLGELLSLRWDDIDLSKRVAIIRGIDGRGTKNEDALRAAPLSPHAVEILESLPQDTREVFPLWKASDSFNKSWRRAVKKGQTAYLREAERASKDPDPDFLVDLRFHDLRHEATSRLFERGVFNSLEIASITGHKSLAMLKRYTHLNAQDLASKLA